MAHEDGSVNARREAWLRIRTSDGETLECLIDTGFDGALVLPHSEASRLNLEILGRPPVIGVGRIRSVIDIAELEVEWLGETRAVEVIVSGGDD